MKFRTGFLIFLLSMLVLCGCNDDVFIERLEASQTEFRLPMLGGAFDVDLSHGDWRLDRVAVNHIDVDGEMIEEDLGVQRSGPLSLEGKGRAIHSNDNFALSVSRPHDDFLHVYLSQSVATREMLVELFLANDYEEVVITIVLEPCGGYRFDRIEYGQVYGVSGEGAVEEGWKVLFTNEGEANVSQEWAVFNDDAARTVSFPASTIQSEDIPNAMWYDELMKYVEEPFEVPLPEPFLLGGGLQFNGLKAPFATKDIKLSAELPDDKVAFSFAPGTTMLTVYWGYVEYWVDYTIWLVHDGGGKPLSFTGSMCSKTYDGTWIRTLDR